jgi:hypothetical protein
MEGSRPRFVVPVQGGRPPSSGHPGPVPAARVAVDRFREVFEQAPVGMGLSEPGGRFTDVNRQLRELLAGTGIDPDAAGPADLARHAPVLDAERWRRALVALGSGRAPSGRADLPLGPPPARRRVRVTASVVVCGDARQWLTHVEDVVDAP